MSPDTVQARGPFALSPDGRTLVFSASTASGASTQLYRRQLGSLATTPISGTENTRFPFLSPDGASVGFVADPDSRPVVGPLPLAALRTVSFDGRPSVTLAEDLLGFAGATWGADGTVVYAWRDGLYRVSANGGRCWG